MGDWKGAIAAGERLLARDAADTKSTLISLRGFANAYRAGLATGASAGHRGDRGIKVC